MPQARKAKKDADPAATTTKRRGRKPKQEVEEEVLEDAEDEDVEESEQPTVRRKITEEIAQRAADMREEGATWTEVQEETGFNGAQLRPHIARLTEATIDTLEDTPESVAEHRDEGYAWYAMAISLGKTIGEVKEMAEEGGSDSEGRVYRSNGSAGAEDEEDEQNEDEEEPEDVKPARGRKVGKGNKAGKTATTKEAPKPAATKKAGTATKRRSRKQDPSDEG